MSQLIKTVQGKENHSINLLSDAPVNTPEGTVDHLMDIRFPGNTTLVNEEERNPYSGKFADAQKKITYVSLANVSGSNIQLWKQQSRRPRQHKAHGP